jgi:hypothetical protein
MAAIFNRRNKMRNQGRHSENDQGRYRGGNRGYRQGFNQNRDDEGRFASRQGGRQSAGRERDEDGRFVSEGHRNWDYDEERGSMSRGGGDYRAERGGYGTENDSWRYQSRDEDGRFAGYNENNYRRSSYSGNDYGEAEGRRGWSGYDEDQPDRSNRFDDDYHHWRQEQISKLDEDYQGWQTERRKKFADEFDKWRIERSKSGSHSNAEQKKS